MKKASLADAFFHWKHLAGEELFACGKQFASPAARRTAKPKKCVRCTLCGASHKRGRILGGSFCRYRSLGVTASTADAFFHWKHLAGDELFACGKQFASPAARRTAKPKKCVRCTLCGASHKRGRILGGSFCRYRSLGVTASTADAFFHWKHLAGDELFARGKQFVSPADSGRCSQSQRALRM